MAKRRSSLAVARDKKKADKVAGITSSGKSHFARKRLGQVRVGPRQARPSWFVRYGWEALAARLRASNSPTMVVAA